MKLIPSRQQLQQSWEKYGLIVVGNIVFFSLLYFVSYRPHNEENRASEFLSMAQQAEAESNRQTARLLYRKVVADYPETRASIVATKRLDYLKSRGVPSPVIAPPKQEPVFDMDRMLDQRPAVYVARVLASHYDEFPELQSKIRQTIEEYLKIAVNYDGVALKSLRTEKEFQRAEFQEAWFSLKPRCQMKADWIYDDFFLKNTGIFPWRNVRVQVTVSQGSKKNSETIRIPLLRPGQLYELTSFDVDKSGEDVICSGLVKSREGSATFHNRI